MIPDWLLDALGGPARCAAWTATILPGALVVNLIDLVLLEHQPVGRVVVIVALAYVALVLAAVLVDVAREFVTRRRAARRRRAEDARVARVAEREVLSALAPEDRAWLREMGWRDPLARWAAPTTAELTGGVRP